MFHLIITSDYELPAGGCGDVRRHMIEPTDKLLETCERNGAKATIMVEIGELWAFADTANERFSKHLGYDPVHAIHNQLRCAVRHGHDVQLHLHPQWLRARWLDAGWDLDYRHYQLSDLGPDEMARVLRKGKEDLELLLRPHDPHYSCIGFRAGHWNTHPSGQYLAALLAAGLRSDTSVFKGGHRDGGGTHFDYRSATSNLRAWYAHPDDINRESGESGILEVPIATQSVPLYRMMTLRRLVRSLAFIREDRRISTAVRAARGSQEISSRSGFTLDMFRRPVPRKLDYCKMTARQMWSAVNKLADGCRGHLSELPIPIVMIGHSKESHTPQDLGRVLAQIRDRFEDRIRFSGYREFFERYTAAIGTTSSGRA